jgi:hypothetical protein
MQLLEIGVPATVDNRPPKSTRETGLVVHSRSMLREICNYEFRVADLSPRGPLVLIEIMDEAEDGYSSSRSLIGFVPSIFAVETFGAIKDDAENSLLPKQRNRFLDTFTRRATLSYYQEGCVDVSGQK